MVKFAAQLTCSVTVQFGDESRNLSGGSTKWKKCLLCSYVKKKSETSRPIARMSQTVKSLINHIITSEINIIKNNICGVKGVDGAVHLQFENLPISSAAFGPFATWLWTILHPLNYVVFCEYDETRATKHSLLILFWRSFIQMDGWFQNYKRYRESLYGIDSRA